MKVFTNPYPRAKKMSRNLNDDWTPDKTFGGDNFGISQLAAGRSI
jgi:hypothetical protein